MQQILLDKSIIAGVSIQCTVGVGSHRNEHCVDKDAKEDEQVGICDNFNAILVVQHLQKSNASL